MTKKEKVDCKKCIQSVGDYCRLFEDKIGIKTSCSEYVENKKQKLLETDFIECVPWHQIEERWGKREYNRFMKWLRGQTCLEQGAYLCDVMSYAEGRNKGIKDPEVYD